MEKHITLIQSANTHFKNADHMVYVTYPLVNDPKLILTIADKLYTSLIQAVDAILNYDYMYKRIEYVPESTDKKLEIFKHHSIKQYNLKREILVLIQDLRALLEFRKKSPLEFTRKDNFVICSGNYSTKTINFKKIKDYIADSKEFLIKINKILSQNGI